MGAILGMLLKAKTSTLISFKYNHSLSRSCKITVNPIRVLKVPSSTSYLGTEFQYLGTCTSFRRSLVEKIQMVRYDLGGSVGDTIA
jgi:hypothetical protein